MFGHRLRKIGALLGLLAILMSTLAPTISQVRASRDPLDAALAAICTANVEHGIETADPGRADHTRGPLHWQACPYCGVLTHLPALPGVPVTFAAARSAAYAFVTARSDAVAAARHHAAAWPRAPPSVLS